MKRECALFIYARRSPRRDVRTVDKKRNVAKDELQELSAQCLSGQPTSSSLLQKVRMRSETGCGFRQLAESEVSGTIASNA